MRYRIFVITVALIATAGVSVFAGGKSESSMLIGVEAMEAIMADENPIILDIRDTSSYMQGHIPGAMLLPLDGVESNAARIAEFGRPIITYCSCPAEESSMNAAMIFQRYGVDRVHVLIGGYRAWVRAGKPTVSGSEPL